MSKAQFKKSCLGRVGYIKKGGQSRTGRANLEATTVLTYVVLYYIEVELVRKFP